MEITRKSVFSGEVRTKDIDITLEQLLSWSVDKVLIQDAMPQLSNDDREFLMTGTTPEEWDEAFGEDDEPTNGLY